MKKLILLFLAIITISCANKTETPDEIYRDRETSVLELRQLVNSKEVNKQSYGSFFLIGGSFSNNETTEVYVKVFAKVNGYFRVISIPIEQLRVNIDNTIEKPNLVIPYHSYKRSDSEVVDKIESHNLDCVINCPEKYLPEKLLPIEL